MTRYASTTTVSPTRSMEEIERTLTRYGAEEFMFGRRSDQGAIEFVASGRRVRFVVELPPQDHPDFTRTPTGKPRKGDAALKEWERACRQRWRALALWVKSALEAIECEIATFDEVFLAHIVLPNGTTVGQTAVPALDELGAGGEVPSLLPGLMSGEVTP
jgi:hypothetical protein